MNFPQKEPIGSQKMFWAFLAVYLGFLLIIGLIIYALTADYF